MKYNKPSNKSTEPRENILNARMHSTQVLRDTFCIPIVRNGEISAWILHFFFIQTSDVCMTITKTQVWSEFD